MWHFLLCYVKVVQECPIYNTYGQRAAQRRWADIACLALAYNLDYVSKVLQ